MTNVRWTRKKKWMKMWKHTYEKKIEKNQINKADYKNKTRKFWKWIVLGGIFFIINRIINWVTSQFLNINFENGSKKPALSKVEFIVTAITMFFHYGFIKIDLFFLFLTCSSSPSNLTPIANNIILSAFSIFSNMI